MQADITKRWQRFHEKLSKSKPISFHGSSIIKNTMPLTPEYDPREYWKKYPNEINKILCNYRESLLFAPMARKTGKIRGKLIADISKVYIYYAVLVLKNFVSLNNFNILEIGPGFGGLCRVLKTAQIGVKQYTLLDHLSMINAAKCYLGERKGKGKVLADANMINISNKYLIENKKFDLLISTYCISETTEEFQSWIYNKIFPNIKRVFIIDGDKININFRKNLIQAIKKNFSICKVIPFVPKIRSHVTEIFIGIK